MTTLSLPIPQKNTDKTLLVCLHVILLVRAPEHHGCIAVFRKGKLTKARKKVVHLESALHELPETSLISTLEGKRRELLEAQKSYEATFDKLGELLADEAETEVIAAEFNAIDTQVNELNDVIQE